MKVWSEHIHAAGVPRRLGSSVFNAKPWFLKTTHATPRKSLAILEWSTVIKHVLLPTLRHLRCHKLIKMAGESFYTWHRYSILVEWKWNNISASCVEHKRWSSSRIGPSTFILHRLQGWSSICDKRWDSMSVCIYRIIHKDAKCKSRNHRTYWGTRDHSCKHYTIPICWHGINKYRNISRYMLHATCHELKMLKDLLHHFANLCWIHEDPENPKKIAHSSRKLKAPCWMSVLTLSNWWHFSPWPAARLTMLLSLKHRAPLTQGH